MKFLARKEDFGGILAEIGSEQVIILDHFCFDVIRAVSKGVSRDDILELARRYFHGDDVGLAIKRTEAVFSVLDGNANTSRIDFSTDFALERFPALSAPLDLYWEITRRCNERCLHCYNNSSPDGFNPTYANLSSIIDELEPYQLRNITLTGGEPMMRRDFWRIVDRVRPLTWDLSMGTNATLIDESNIEQIERYFDVLNVSLDHPHEKEFDSFRGYPGAFARTLKGLRLLSSRNVRVYIQSVITKNAVRHLDALGQLVSSLKPDQWIVRFAFDSGRAVKNSNEFLTGLEIFQLKDRLEDLRERFSNRIPNIMIGSNYPWSYERPYKFTHNPNRLQTCAAATTHAALDAFGRMAPCSLFTETNYKTRSVYESSFLEQWRNSVEFEALRTLRLKDVSGCGTCENATGACGAGCRAKAYMKYGTIRKSDYSCNYSS